MNEPPLTRIGIVELAMKYSPDITHIKFNNGGWVGEPIGNANVYLIVQSEKFAKYLGAWLPNSKVTPTFGSTWVVHSKNVFAHMDGDPWLGLCGDSEEIEFRD